MKLDFKRFSLIAQKARVNALELSSRLSRFITNIEALVILYRCPRFRAIMLNDAAFEWFDEFASILA